MKRGNLSESFAWHPTSRKGEKKERKKEDKKTFTGTSIDPSLCQMNKITNDVRKQEIQLPTALSQQPSGF